MAFRLYLYYTMYTSCLVVRSDGPLPLTLIIVIVDVTKVSKHQSLGGGHPTQEQPWHRHHGHYRPQYDVQPPLATEVTSLSQWANQDWSYPTFQVSG